MTEKRVLLRSSNIGYISLCCDGAYFPPLRGDGWTQPKSIPPLPCLHDHAGPEGTTLWWIFHEPFHGNDVSWWRGCCLFLLVVVRSNFPPIEPRLWSALLPKACGINQLGKIGNIDLNTILNVIIFSCGNIASCGIGVQFVRGASFFSPLHLLAQEIHDVRVCAQTGLSFLHNVSPTRSSKSFPFSQFSIYRTGTFWRKICQFRYR